MFYIKFFHFLFLFAFTLPLVGQKNSGDKLENPRQVFYAYLKTNAPDTFERINARFYKGHLFSESDEHIVMLYRETNSDVVEIYHLKNNTWQRLLYYDSLDLFWIQADIEVMDMNFDGKPDLLVKAYASNGYPMMAVYLFINNGSAFRHIAQADTLNNLSVDEDRTVIAEQLIWCKDGAKYGTMATACKSYYKWQKDRLVFIRKECPCTPQE